MKLRYILATGLAVAALSACTNLDTDIKSNYVQYPDDPIALEGKLTDCYYSFREVLKRDYKEGIWLSSDESTPISFGGDYAETNRYSNPYFHNFSADDNFPWATWNTLQGGITTCNKVLLEVGGENGKDPAAAPVRAMRAFYHFIMLDAFGDIPLANRNFGEDEAVDRAPRAEVTRWIEQELLEIIPQLNDANDNSTYGKPNKWMAEALLAKIYLNWAVYTCGDITSYTPSIANEKLNDCVALIDDIISSGNFEVGNGYRVKFLPDNGPQIKDFIYVADYDMASLGQGHDWARYTTFRQAGKCQPTTYYGFPLSKSVGGNICFTPEFTDLFCLEGDERNEIVLKGDICLLNPVDYSYTNEPCVYEDGRRLHFTRDIVLAVPNDVDNNVGKSFEGWCTGYKTIKFPPRQVDYDNYNRNQSNDIPIFRYADMLLMKAECILRGATATRGDTPQSLINQVRQCSHAPQIGANVSLNDLYQERGRELANEIWRRNDMIRYGHFEDEYGTKVKSNPNAKFDTFRRIWPVPTGMLNNNTNWKQNPGY